MTAAPVISVIDDDASIRAAINNLLRSLGYIVHVFASAEAFLQSPQLITTSCVITDVRMPGMSGVELQSFFICEAGRATRCLSSSSPPFPTRAFRARAFGDGAVCSLLAKPFDEDVLIRCLGKVIELGGADR